MLLDAFDLALAEVSNDSGQIMAVAIEQIAVVYSDEIDKLITRKFPKEREVLRQIPLNSPSEIIKWRKGWLELIRRAQNL